MASRGIRNNNPGNIRHGDAWQGLAEKQTDSSFCMFRSAEYGIRALAKVLLNYECKYGLNTVRKIIGRYAPVEENDTAAYVASVAGQLGVGADEAIEVADKTTLLVLVKAIIRHENGEQPYSNEILIKGLEMAGVK